ncbi:BACON domain-containing protein, partial [Odoribacter lunatus]|uniref:BACON domain-containing protein n=1 Tax=Odoribacter lunatus TaxID=2941335 RepID=UPI00203E4C2E
MMKKFLYGVLCLALLVGCGKDKEKDFEPDEPDTPVTPTVVTLELSDADLIFDAEGGQKTFTITSNAEWTITNESDWCTTDVASGSGNRTVTVRTQTYNALEDRNMNLTVKAGDKTQVLTVTQKYGNAIVPDKAKFEVAQGGGDLAIRVRSNMTYEVTIPEFCSSWIQPAPETRAEISDTTYRFIIAKNESKDSRMGFIIFTSASLSDTVRIFQAEKDQLMLTKKEYNLLAKDTTITIELRTNIDYDILFSELVDWLEVVQTRAVRTDRIVFRVMGNTSNVSRGVKVIFKDKNGALADTLQVRQFTKGTHLGGIVFKTKQDLIDFHATGNTVIVGNVTMGGTELKNLQELGDLLVEIDGDLSLECDALESLEGLGGLKQITGSLVVTASSSVFSSSSAHAYSMRALTSFTGLTNLKSIGKNFIITASASSSTSYFSSSSLDSLKSFEGLENLESIGGNFVVSASSNNPSSSSNPSSSLISLESFNGLGKLKSIGGDFKVYASNSLNALQSFAGLESLESIGGSFKVASSSFSYSSLKALKSFSGLSKLKSIGGDFEVISSFSSNSSLSSLESFAGLESLESIGGSFKVISSSYSSSNSLESLKSLKSLKSFEGLSKLKSIGGDFEVNANDSYYSSFSSL